MMGSNESRSGYGMIVRYKECQRNHAAKLMRYAFDGCGEYAPGGPDGSLEALHCAACGCHRNFHRREEVPPLPAPRTQPRLRIVRRATADASPLPPPPLPLPHHPPPILPRPEPPAPPEVEPQSEQSHAREKLKLGAPEESKEGKKKRARTKLTPEQKARMRAMAEKMFWRPQKHDEGEIRQLCLSIGIIPEIFKNWVNNNRKKVESGQSSSSSAKN